MLTKLESRCLEIRRGKSLGLFTRSTLIGTLAGAGFFIAAIPISAWAQTSDQIAALQIAARQAQKNADLAISQRDTLQAQPEDAALATIHRDSLLEDATLATGQPDSLQNQPKIGKAGPNPSQQTVASAADQAQPQQEQQSVTSEALPAPVPAKLQAENEQATVSQSGAHRSLSESARPQRMHRARETKTQNSVASATGPSFLSQLQNQWNRIWHVRSNSKRSDYHPNAP
jgi:hypothetical protein